MKKYQRIEIDKKVFVKNLVKKCLGQKLLGQIFLSQVRVNRRGGDKKICKSNKYCFKQLYFKKFCQGKLNNGAELTQGRR